MRLIINGDNRDVEDGLTVAELLQSMGLDARKIAVERNREIVSRSKFAETHLAEGDQLEIVHFIGGGNADDATPEAASGDTPLVIAGREFNSRLLVGTGKYKDFEETARAIEASGAEIVTVAVRRVNVTDPSAPMLMDYVDPRKYTYLPNTAVAIRPRTPCAPCAWRVRQAAGHWSSWRCWAIRKRFIRT